MRLSAPTMLVFIISVALAGVVIAAKYFGVAIPYVSAHLFEALLAAYALLLAGNLFRNI